MFNPPQEFEMFGTASIARPAGLLLAAANPRFDRNPVVLGFVTDKESVEGWNV
jgi:hypothetical protein